ncbi:MAG: terminase large subunit [Actinomycetota bacterium]|nr:terminase large subunit [Actinomycetota bacterium]
MISRALLWFALVAAVAAPRAPRARKPRKRKYEVNTLEHFAEFCRRFIVLDNGRPFELEPFQRLILKGFFAGVTELLVLLPKKNGKTTLLAALALYHLIYTPDAKCYIAASAKDQAKVLYDQACGFVERKDLKTGKLLPQAAALQKRVLLRKATKEIRSRRDSGFIWVVSGDKDTVDGVIVTLGLVDELHRHKDNGQLYGVLADGVGPRNGQIVTISTAGERLKSALGRIRAKAYKFGVKRLEQFGRCNFARSPNGKFEMYEWTLDEDDSREDLDIVKLANPLESNTIESLRQRKESPTMTASRWARFGCGVWMQGEDAAISSIDVGRCAIAPDVLPATSAIYLSLDIGWRWDTTVVVPGMPHDREDWEEEDEKTGRSQRFWRYRKVRYGKPTILVPPRDGTSLPHEDVINAVVRFKKQGYEILGVVFDRNAEGEKVAQELEREHGLDVIMHSQDASPMADASMGLATAIGTVDENGERMVELPDDPEFIAQLLAARARTTSGEKWRFDAPKENRGQRKHGQQDSDDVEVIDAAIAAAMLHRIATAPVPVAPDRSAYRMEFA